MQLRQFFTLKLEVVPVFFVLGNLGDRLKIDKINIGSNLVGRFQQQLAFGAGFCWILVCAQS